MDNTRMKVLPTSPRWSQVKRRKVVVSGKTMIVRVYLRELAKAMARVSVRKGEEVAQVNHYEMLKDAYLEEGLVGVRKYREAILNLIKVNENAVQGSK